jgi:hypothetical protein
LLLCGLQQSGRLPAEGQLQAAAAQLGIAAERLQIDLSGLPLPDLLLQTAVPAKSSTAQPAQVLLVSHWYELSRLRLLARRAGLQPATVAARQQHALFRQNQLIAGECLLMLGELASPVIDFARQSRVASETILDAEAASSDPATPGADPAVNPADPFRQL